MLCLGGVRMRGHVVQAVAAVLCAWAPGATGVDYYKLLGINEFADADEIKKAYRQASLKYHPDKYSGDPAEAQAIMVQVNDAFNCLKNPATRKMYEYYENDYESMAEYESQLKKEHLKDLYLYDANVHIVWHKNKDLKLKNMTRITVLNLYHPQDQDSVKHVAEFKRFGKMAEKSPDLRAAVVNCQLDQGLCHSFWKQMGRKAVPAFLIFSSLQTDENMATDFEVWDDEKFGFPTAKELARQARKLVAHQVVQADGAFLEANVTRNPRVTDSNYTGITVWVAWLYHSARCSKTDACDKTAPAVRQLSNELKGVARIVAVDCKVYKTSCRGHLESGASVLKAFIHRGSRHFVEAFRFDVQGKEPPEASALRGAALVLRYVLKPQVNLTYPDDPFRPAAALEPEAGVELASMDPKTMRVGQLKELLANLGAKCVGCSEKADFVARVLELRGEGGAGSSGEL